LKFFASKEVLECGIHTRPMAQNNKPSECVQQLGVQ